MLKFLKYFFVVIAILLFLLFININNGLADLAALAYPAARFWVHAALLCVEAAGCLWLFRGFWSKNEYLEFNPTTPEEQARFIRILTIRLQYNPIIREAGLDPAEPEQFQKCLALLHKKANEITRKTAERTFLATSLSQNGRIDALIMFLSLCHLVWSISKIYNQRPNPTEMVALFGAVASSTFLAFSVEELDISTEIAVGFGESFHAMAPATMTGGVPFVGAALQKFTSSVIDGAANCYLVLRTGIIARNAYACNAQAQPRPGRVVVFREAGSMLVSMSGYLIEQVTKALRDTLWGFTKNAGNTAVQATVHAGQTLAGSAVRMGEGITTTTVTAVQATGGLLKDAGSTAMHGVAGAAVGTSRHITRAAVAAGKSIFSPFRKKN